MAVSKVLWSVCEEFAKIDREFKDFASSNESRSSKPSYSDGTTKIIDETNSTIAAWGAIICAILGCLGNVLTIYVLLRKKSLRKHSTTPFLLSLAVSDLGFCAFNLPLTAVRFFERDWVFRMCTCKLFPFFFYANISISVFSLAGVALNRYVGLFYPHLMDTLFSRTKSALMVLLVWLCSFAMMMLPFFKVWGQLGYEPLIFNCTVLKHNDKNPLSFFLALGSGLPMVIITFCYVRIYCMVKKTGQNIRNEMDNECPNPNLMRMLKKREIAMTKTGIMVWLGYVLCFLPTTLIMMIDPMPPKRNFPGLHVAGYIIFWCSGFINPIIYIASNKYYRAAMKEVICRVGSMEDIEMVTSRVTSRVNSRQTSRATSRASSIVKLRKSSSNIGEASKFINPSPRKNSQDQSTDL